MEFLKTKIFKKITSITTIIVAIISIPLSSIAQKRFSADTLSPKGHYTKMKSQLNSNSLKCYNMVLKDETVLVNIKANPSITTDIVEKWALFSCTYSDDLGFKRCYQQGMAESRLFSHIRNTKNDFETEKEIIDLCRASFESGFIKATGLSDAIDCYLTVLDSTELLTSLRSPSWVFDNHLKNLCRNSHGAGAKSCLLEAKDKDNFKRSNDDNRLQTAREIDEIEICKHSRKWQDRNNSK
jgi:hypothetical protein